MFQSPKAGQAGRCTRLGRVGPVLSVSKDGRIRHQQHVVDGGPDASEGTLGATIRKYDAEVIGVDTLTDISAGSPASSIDTGFPDCPPANRLPWGRRNNRTLLRAPGDEALAIA